MEILIPLVKAAGDTWRSVPITELRIRQVGRSTYGIKMRFEAWLISDRLIFRTCIF